VEDKGNREELNGLSSQLMELFVADLFSKNKINVQQVKERITEEQRESLKQTVEQLKAQVEGFLESKTVIQVDDSEEKTEGHATNPLREAIIQRKQMKQNKKNNTNR
jgi:preprotein translocase subunit SecD